MVRTIVAFFLAVAVMDVLGATAHALFVQDAWTAIANSDGTIASIPLTDRLAWIGHDIMGMLPMHTMPYGPLIVGAFLIAFPVASLISRLVGLRTLAFALAGAVAILAALTTVKMLFGTIGVFGARTALGMASQMTAGLIAGYVFARVSLRNSPET